MTEAIKKAQILLIDDEEEIRETMRPILEDAGYAVYCAADGAAAIAAAKTHPCDILLVDYSLPDTDGLRLIKDILAFVKDAIPLIISGASSIEIAVEGMRIGAHDYLLKPVDMNDLLKIISTVLREREEYRKGRLNIEKIVKNLGEEPVADAVTIVCQNKNNMAGHNSKAPLPVARDRIGKVLRCFRKRV